MTAIIWQDIELGHPLRRTNVGDRQASHQDTGNQRGTSTILPIEQIRKDIFWSPGFKKNAHP